ncbi:MAG: 30S ribosomal protein S20 [Bacillota bacterium]|nr:30S ribosomal protein S20 [Candidatus Fermentithermobacillaceae bacterium]HOA71464.1 30S ribosomal protein S20 [Bacillota bacterium]HOP71439.1 30S ribosomal protein S20 [Bacillota bacterium]HPT36193.1 30S ribosomal protein S20 [Bacillota bacterium]HPZ86191.1 30S ribosomal protein S20 [Bacillota bacterium]
MANIKSSIKDIERNRKRRMRNRAIKSRVRTYIRKFREAVESGDKQLAMEAYKAAQSQIDRAVSKGVLKRNTGSRYKSRLAARLMAM